jgi:nucleoporin POM152
VDVELIRVDLETNQEESLKLSKAQLREIHRNSKRASTDEGPSVVQFDYAAKKPGAYRLGTVLDEYKLEVQRKTPYTFVVPCPELQIQSPVSLGRCHGDLSDLSLQVDGTPPLKIVYSRTINGNDHSFHFQSLQPDGFTSPLLGSPRSTSLMSREDDISWARSQRVTVGLNESMNTGGLWEYSVDEVHDAFGNVVKYTPSPEDAEIKPRPKHLAQSFTVKERPKARLKGCDLRNPLKVAKGKSKELPVLFEIQGRTPDDTAHSLTWQFSPIDTLTKNGDHGDVITTGSYDAKHMRDHPTISAPGLYTLKSVSSGQCEGEIQEPSSCLLLNPLEPKLTVRSEEIPDICAGNSIGLRVDLDLIGTPPFIVRYAVISNGQEKTERVVVHGMRTQLDLIPTVAGNHKYIFKQIDDDIYKAQPLVGDEYSLEQDVKPAASAHIQHSTGRENRCLEEAIEVDVALIGEAPFTLEWEIVHDGKRKTDRATAIDGSSYTITTAPLTQGGDYTLALTSVQDKRGCRNFLQEEIKVNVRMQRPRAGFGEIEKRRQVKVIEDAKVNLPLRLTGVGPWTISYRNLQDESKILQKTVGNDNDFLDVLKRGTYEIVDVYDKQCPGSVDPKASTFEVDWFPRPELSLVPADDISEYQDRYRKQDVCEGDVDGFEISLRGKQQTTRGFVNIQRLTCSS